MTAIVWDDTGKRFYETGIDQGVLYVMDSNGDYPLGVAWNGLVGVTESPSGAEASALWADNVKYLSLLSAEEFGLTLEAYTYPDEFGVCDGSVVAVAGVKLGQQSRSPFGLVYRTKIGNDVDGQDHAYLLHLVYGCLAAPSERGYQTVNESPDAITFSWEVTTTPPVITGHAPSAIITIDSRTAPATELAALELVLFGDVAVDPELPSPDDVIAAMTP